MQFKIIIPNIEPESNISENQVILTSRQWKNNFLCQIYSQKREHDFDITVSRVHCILFLFI